MTTASEATQAAQKTILETLEDKGELCAAAYSKAVAKLHAEGEDENERAQEAIKIIGEALAQVSEELAKSLGFAELLLVYADALMVSVKSQDSKDALGPTVPKGIPAADGIDGGVTEGNGAVDTEKEEGEGDGVDKIEAVKQEDSEKGGVEGENVEKEDEEDDSEVVWESLEIARTIFETNRDKASQRLVKTYEKLGDFLMAMDKNKEAAVEYGKAAALEDETVGDSSRLLALLCHSQYLALRKDNQEEALRTLKTAIEVFARHVEAKEKREGVEAVKDDREVLQEMQGELRSYEAILRERGVAVNKIKSALEQKSASSGKENEAKELESTLKDKITPAVAPGSAAAENGKSDVASATVVQVQPRRKKKKEPNGQENNGELKSQDNESTGMKRALPGGDSEESDPKKQKTDALADTT